jgi:integrase
MTNLAMKENNVKSMPINYIFDEYNSFLDDKKPNTRKNYMGDLKQFFMEVYGKEPKHVTVDDMSKTTGTMVMNYRNKLREKYAKATTVNRKINAIRSFFSFMEADHKEIRSAIFNKLKKIPENDKKGWGSLTPEEVQSMIETVKDLSNGQELSVLIEVAYITAIRLDALLTMTYKENIYLREEDGNNIWVIDVIDKDEKHVKAISNDLKRKIDLLGRREDERVFMYLNDHKVGTAIRYAVEKLGLDERRNIRFHSLKKASINYVLATTGDIKQAQLQGNHKSSRTTLDNYVEQNKKLADQPSLTIGTTIDTNPLHELSHEELLAVIENSSNNLKLELLRNLNKQ